jgi:hypothetical protein
MSLFNKATRTQVYLKLGLTGGPGDGKTFSGLRLAGGLANGKRIAVSTQKTAAPLFTPIDLTLT